MGLPVQNRVFLEVLCTFLSIVHALATDKGTDNTKNLDLRGFAVVLTPILFLKNKIVDMKEVNELVEVRTFIFENFKKIYEVDENLCFDPRERLADLL